MMDNEIVVNEWQIKIEDYYGPLSKLLELIKKNHMMILKFDLLQITSQYVDYVNELLKNALSEKELDEISDYLYMAQYLINLKSRYLVKQQIEQNLAGSRIELEGDYLNKLLLSVQVYKDAMSELAIKQNERSLIFNKKNDNFEQFLPNDFNYEKIPDKLSPNILLKYLQELDSHKESDKLETVIQNYEILDIPFDEIVSEIISYLKNNNASEFLRIAKIIYGSSPFFKYYLVSMFIACLVLSNEHKIKLYESNFKLYLELIK